MGLRSYIYGFNHSHYLFGITDLMYDYRSPYNRQVIEVVDVNNFYDFLAKLVDRTPWANEYDKEVFAQLIAKLRELNVFGYMVSTTTVDNPDKHRAKFRG